MYGIYSPTFGNVTISIRIPPISMYGIMESIRGFFRGVFIAWNRDPTFQRAFRWSLPRRWSARIRSSLRGWRTTSLFDTCKTNLLGFCGWVFGGGFLYGFDPMGFFTTLHHHLGEYVCHFCKHLKQFQVFGFGKRLKKVCRVKWRFFTSRDGSHNWEKEITLPEPNIAPKNGWLEY